MGFTPRVGSIPSSGTIGIKHLQPHPIQLTCPRRLRCAQKCAHSPHSPSPQGYTDVKALVAFSGTVRDRDTGAESTEPGMNNGISETDLRNVFATTEYQLLLVANKYQTGNDQPLLHTMYVDKRLDGVQAVQTLSRLNTHPGRTDTFVLDFVNEAADIQLAFQPYYEQTTESERADPQHLYQLQTELDASNVYYQSEVEADQANRIVVEASCQEESPSALNRFQSVDLVLNTLGIVRVIERHLESSLTGT